MDNPKVSVIIPTYNGREYINDAIQSVLDQTYPNLELIIVDDSSPEDMSLVVKSFLDTRIRYIRHKRNLGAVAARKTGVGASSGEIIAFLDQDDLFHKKKLEMHVAYFLKNPETGLTYNARFEIQGSAKTLCGIHKPPTKLSIADWVLGFPVCPSDTVLKREWAVREEVWDDSFADQAEHVIFNGQEIVFGGRLALAGCKFGYVEQVLNYRRYHPYRRLRYLAERCNTELACQEMIFNDSRCPEDAKKLRSLAFSNIYLMWAFAAYIQEEFDLGQRLLKEAIVLNPDFFMDSDPCQFLSSWILWISAGTVDYIRGHEEILQTIFENLPREIHHLKKKYSWAIARGNLIKGLHTMIWGKPDEAEFFLTRAIEMGSNIDEAAMKMLIDELLIYEAELGAETGQKVINNLSNLLAKLNRQDSVQLLTGFYVVNRAFRNYNSGEYEYVPGDVVKAVTSDFKYLLNKGVLSILFRSLLWRMKLTGKPTL